MPLDYYPEPMPAGTLMLLFGAPLAHVLDWQLHQHRRSCPGCFHAFHMQRIRQENANGQ